MGKGSTVKLGSTIIGKDSNNQPIFAPAGTLTIQTETWNSQTGNMDFTGTWESSRDLKIFPVGFGVSDDIGPIPVTGHIHAVPTLGPWSYGSLGGVPVSYFTTGIDFQGAGDGKVGSLQLPDHQTVSYSGSVLTWVLPTGPVQYSMSGSFNFFHDDVTEPDGRVHRDDPPSLLPTQGVSFAGMNWSSITFL
jgi:hypothetical protein